MPSRYLIFKFIHVLGVVVLLGNVTVTAVWKVFADRTRDARVVAFAQRLVIGTDYAFTLGGIILIVVGGYGMGWTGGVSLATGWILWGQVLFLVSGLIWAVFLLPIQATQSSLAKDFGRLDQIPGRYQMLGRRWLIMGIVATIPLVAAMYFMIVKP